VICDGICGKRLAPYLKEIVAKLEDLGKLTLDKEVKRKLIGISPATIDRMLAPVRKRYQLRARSQTKPGTLLKHQIPIRTFSDWDEQRATGTITDQAWDATQAPDPNPNIQ